MASIFAFCLPPSAASIHERPDRTSRPGFFQGLAYRMVFQPVISALRPRQYTFHRNGDEKLCIPIQLWASTYGGDGVTPDSVAAVRRNLPVAPDWRLVENATHFGFVLPCTPALLKSKPEICSDHHGFDRTAFHADFNARILAFFKQHLGPAAAISTQPQPHHAGIARIEVPTEVYCADKKSIKRVLKISLASPYP